MLVVNPALYRAPGFDPVKDFEPVALVATADADDVSSAARKAARRAVGVLKSRGVAIPEAAVDETLAMVDKKRAEMKTSMSQDLERGNRLEAPWLSGAVARLGREMGVPTPVHATLAAALRPYQDGAKK